MHYPLIVEESTLELTDSNLVMAPDFGDSSNIVLSGIGTELVVTGRSMISADAGLSPAGDLLMAEGLFQLDPDALYAARGYPMFRASGGDVVLTGGTARVDGSVSLTAGPSDERAPTRGGNLVVDGAEAAISGMWDSSGAGAGTSMANDFSHGGKVIVSGGSLTLNAGSVFNLRGGSNEVGPQDANPGRVEVSGGVLTINGAHLYGGAASTPVDPIDVFGVDLIATGGVVELKGDATVRVAEIAIDGGEFHSIADLTLAQEATVRLASGTLSANRIVAEAQDALELTGGTFSFRKLEGTVDQRGGSHAVGGLGETGESVITGDYLLNGGELAIDLADPDAPAGDSHDCLQVQGALILDASTKLQVSRLTGYAAQPGDVFTVVKFGTRSGEFGGVIGLPGRGMHYQLEYRADEVLLMVLSGLDGDYNNDGMVNFADYTVWRDHLDAGSKAMPNDPNAGEIGEGQYATWKQNFGAALADSDLEAPSSVPEPYACILMSAALICAMTVNSRLASKRCGRESNRDAHRRT